MITQAVIAAGGFGTRLAPFTDSSPKPMIPLLGKPLLEWNIEQFKAHGVTDIVLVLHYLPDVIRAHFGDGSAFGVRISYFIEDEPIGSAGALRALAPHLHETFFFLYGDVLSLVDYARMATHFEALGDVAAMQRVAPVTAGVVQDADLAELDGTGRILAIHAKPHDRAHDEAYRMRGIFILNKNAIAHIPAEGTIDMGKDVFPALVSAGERVYGYQCDDYSKGIDTVKKRDEAEAYLRSIHV